MNRLMAFLAIFFISSGAFADTLTFNFTGGGEPPSPLSFSIPSEPNTASVFVTYGTGTAGNTILWGDTTPIFTVPVTGSLTLLPVYWSDQYGDEGYIFLSYSLTGFQNYGLYTGLFCNIHSPPSCDSLFVPNPITIEFSLPAFSQISFGAAIIEIDAVPEPSTWAMLLIGFAVIGFALRRRHAE